MKKLISNARRTVSMSDDHVVASADAQRAAQDPLELLIQAEDEAEREDNVTVTKESKDGRKRNSRL